jgi:hypothetical protein
MFGNSPQTFEKLFVQVQFDLGNWGWQTSPTPHFFNISSIMHPPDPPNHATMHCAVKVVILNDHTSFDVPLPVSWWEGCEILNFSGVDTLTGNLVHIERIAILPTDPPVT